jgi:Cu(I)/Ag(I) efflux system membrane fusion protein
MTSMMNLPRDAAAEPNAPDLPADRQAGPMEHEAMMDLPEEFRASLDDVYDALFRASSRLADDELNSARSALTDANEAMSTVDANALPPAARPTWQRLADALTSTLQRALAAENLSGVRREFYPVSRQFARIVRDFGPTGDKPIYEFRCPMAFDNRGATWLQRSKELANPYFGSSMLRCGELVRTFTPPRDAGRHEGHDHTEGP